MINLDGYGDDQGFDWSTHAKEIGDASKIRLSIKSHSEVYVALAETNESMPRRINYIYAGWGNKNNVKLIERESDDYQWGDPEDEYCHEENPSLYGDRPRWFEIDLNVEDKPDMV